MRGQRLAESAGVPVVERGVFSGELRSPRRDRPWVEGAEFPGATVSTARDLLAGPRGLGVGFVIGGPLTGWSKTATATGAAMRAGRLGG
ncbi:hypothetical protein [Streptomyces sp. NPDC048248]|uniref:hypothetical protein n=1 Tax=Streptomyces sp. NPDC048248 TaxID=3365523 RepID=UPI0037132C4E